MCEPLMHLFLKWFIAQMEPISDKLVSHEWEGKISSGKHSWLWMYSSRARGRSLRLILYDCEGKIFDERYDNMKFSNCIMIKIFFFVDGEEMCESLKHFFLKWFISLVKHIINMHKPKTEIILRFIYVYVFLWIHKKYFQIDNYCEQLRKLH
jgi:hypothetical protein